MPKLTPKASARLDECLHAAHADMDYAIDLLRSGKPEDLRKLCDVAPLIARTCSNLAYRLRSISIR